VLTLAQASSYFDRTPACDVLTGATLFLCQVDPFADSARDSATAYRRILSVKPGTAMPASRTLKIFGRVWVIGDSEIDGMSTMHREKYVLHPADYQFSYSTLSDYVSGVAGSTAWGSLEWFKDGKEDASSSRVVPMYSAYCSTSVPLSEFGVISVGSKGYLLSTPHLQASGMQTATCLQLEHSVVDATLSTRVYDPTQGKYTTSVTTTIKCQRVRWQSLYLYGSQGDAKYQEGDCSLVFPVGTTLATKDSVTLAGQVWNVLAVEIVGGAVVAHGRPV
jgi:hypothetical protein